MRLRLSFGPLATRWAMRSVILHGIMTFALLVPNYAAASKPLRPVVLPMHCDVIQIKSVESNAYLGVSRTPAGGHRIAATHDYASPSTHFVVEYVRDADGPMVLSPAMTGSHRRQVMLSFDSSSAVTARPRATGDLWERPCNTSLWFGGWPVIRHQGAVFAGGFYRMYLLGDAYPHNPIGLVGSSHSGHLSVYSMDQADRPGATFIRPPTLFFVNVVSSPGPEACLGSSRR